MTVRFCKLISALQDSVILFIILVRYFLTTSGYPFEGFAFDFMYLFHPSSLFSFFMFLSFCLNRLAASYHVVCDAGSSLAPV